MTEKAEKLTEELNEQKKTFDDEIKKKDTDFAANVKLYNSSQEKNGKLESKVEKLTLEKKNLQNQIVQLKSQIPAPPKITKTGKQHKKEEESLQG
jgi:hypothetical protein